MTTTAYEEIKTIAESITNLQFQESVSSNLIFVDGKKKSKLKNILYNPESGLIILISKSDGPNHNRETKEGISSVYIDGNLDNKLLKDKLYECIPKRFIINKQRSVCCNRQKSQDLCCAF